MGVSTDSANGKEILTRKVGAQIGKSNKFNLGALLYTFYNPLVLRQSKNITGDVEISLDLSRVVGMSRYSTKTSICNWNPS